MGESGQESLNPQVTLLAQVFGSQACPQDLCITNQPSRPSLAGVKLFLL